MSGAKVRNALKLAAGTPSRETIWVSPLQILLSRSERKMVRSWSWCGTRVLANSTLVDPPYCESCPEAPASCYAALARCRNTSSREYRMHLGFKSQSTTAQYPN
jgi:hypothetical protein